MPSSVQPQRSARRSKEASALAPATVRDVWEAHPGYLQAWALNVLLAGWVGLTGVFSNPGRFSSDTYLGVNAGLGVVGWSLLLCAVTGSLLAAPWLRASTAIGVFLVNGAIYLTLGAYFAGGLSAPLASPWGPPFVLVVGLWQLTQAEAYRQAVRGHGRKQEAAAAAALAAATPPGEVKP